MLRTTLLLFAWTVLDLAAAESIDIDARFEAIDKHLSNLPRLARIELRQTALPEGMRPFAEHNGISVVPGPDAPAVILVGTSLFAKGPADGLEVLACLNGGKNHEAFMYLDTANGVMVNAVFKAILDLPDGTPAPQGSCLPARGTPLAVDALWVDDPFLDEDGMVGVAASSLVRDRTGGQPFPTLPYIYTGSRLRSIQMPGPEGRTVVKEIFMLDNTKSVVVNFDEPDALLASPFPDAVRDISFEVNSAVAPEKGSRVHLVFRRTTLPLELDMDADGKLALEGVVLDDEAVRSLLQKHFGPEVGMRAIGIRVSDSTSRLKDVEVRERLLGLAVAAETWVVPVFVLDRPVESDGT